MPPPPQRVKKREPPFRVGGGFSYRKAGSGGLMALTALVGRVSSSFALQSGLLDVGRLLL